MLHLITSWFDRRSGLFVSGFIGHVHLQIPVSHLKSQPWVITLDKLYLVAGPISADEVSEGRRSSNKMSCRTKLR